VAVEDAPEILVLTKHPVEAAVQALGKALGEPEEPHQEGLAAAQILLALKEQML
jgi:hypothetical protein